MAIDPGSKTSGVIIKNADVIEFAKSKMDNQEILSSFAGVDVLVVELFVLHGQGGADCRETLIWTGRIWEAWKRHSGQDPIFYTRIKVTSTLKCPPKSKDPRGMDSKVRAAMIERYGESVLKAARVVEHATQALALIAVLEIEGEKRAAGTARHRRRTNSHHSDAD